MKLFERISDRIANFRIDTKIKSQKVSGLYKYFYSKENIESQRDAFMKRILSPEKYQKLQDLKKAKGVKNARTS